MSKLFKVSFILKSLPFRLFIVAFAALITWLSLNWNLSLVDKHITERALHEARGIFTLVLTARQWNSLHNGVYVKVDEKTKPNPYLKDPQRDIMLGGVMYTKINPAYMTREIADLTKSGAGIQLNITSLSPVSQKNKADGWEKIALEEFLKGKKEYYGLVETKRGLAFRYAAPLFMEKECEQCHDERENINNTRGAITISIPAEPLIKMIEPQRNAIKIFHLFVFLSFTLMIWLTLAQLRRDLIERRKMEERIKHQAYHDALTDLPNRRMFEEILELSIKQAQRAKTHLAVAFLDIDGFKNVNDTFGHQMGDELLKQVSQRLTEAIRGGDVIARQGGDEFIILLNPIAERKEIEKVAERILKTIQQPFKIQNHLISVTTSIGFSLYPLDGENLSELIKKADIALYKSKQNGRNRYTIYSD